MEKKLLTEEEYKLSVNIEFELSKYFHLYKEIEGVHVTGKKYIIDYIIKPKDIEKWANKDIVFGIEVKSPDMLKSTNNFTYWVRQCVNYSFTKWGRFGYIIILTYPSFLAYIDRDINEMKNKNEKDYFKFYFKRIMGEFDIGELSKDDVHGWGINLKGHNMWTENYGVSHAKKWKFKKEFPDMLFNPSFVYDLEMEYEYR